MTLHRGFSTSVLFGKIPVCLSVTTLAKASLGSTLRRRYVQHWYRLFSRFLTRGFSKKPPVLKLWRELKSQYANEYMLTTTSYGADAATFRHFRRQGLLWFFQSLMVGYTLVRQRATSLSATHSRAGLRLLLAVFRILSVTFSLMRGLSQSLAHAQQR